MTGRHDQEVNRAASLQLKGLLTWPPSPTAPPQERWEKENAAAPLRPQPPTTVSGVPIDALYTPENLDGFDPDTDLGYPGQYPFTRGVHATHVPQPAVDHAAVRRLRHAAADQRALQVPARQGPDRPEHRLRPADADGPRQRRSALARRGRPARRRRRYARRHAASCSTASTSAKVSVSMTINAPAIVVMAFFLANAQDRGVDWKQLRGTIQNDILKEFHAQNEFVFPPEPHVRLVCDVIEFCTAARAAVEHRVDQRLPHPRGRLDRRAGAGLHAGRRLPLRRHLPGPRPGRRRLRPAAELLLQRPQRPLRGDRQVPRRPRALGRDAAQQVRRQQGERRGSCASTPRRPAARCRTSSRR